MRKTIYLINSLLAVALFSMLIAVLSVTHSVAFAATEDSLKSNVSVTGEDIVEGNTYYLQWSNLSVVYNGSSQVSAAVLKCNEDSSFEKTATVYVKNKAGEAVTAVNAGDYVAVAECNGINFGEGENQKEFSISPLSVAVDWKDTEDYVYDGNAKGPAASVDTFEGTVALTPNGYGINAGTYTASVTADAAGDNYTLTNLTCEYEIKKRPVAVDWKDTEDYVYDGNAKGPAASVDTFEGTVTLTPNGYGTNAGTHTASVTADAAGVNYTLTNLTCGYTISPKSVTVDWDKAERYTYSGQVQGPTASYTDVGGVRHTLTASGLGTNAGVYTASVTADAAESNYSLTNLTCKYEIGKFVGKVLWVVSDYYIANGQPQAPRVFVVGVNGDFIELPIKGAGIKAGEYTVEIDLSKVDSNIELSGETSYKYEIKLENLFGPVGTAFSIIFGILFAGSVGFIIYWFCFRKKKDDEQLKENEQCVSRLQEDIGERDRTISKLQYNNQRLRYDIVAVQDELERTKRSLSTLKKESANSQEEKLSVRGELERAKRSLSALERTLTETEEKLAEAKRQLSETEPTDKETVDKLRIKIKNLTEQLQNLSEENEQLKVKKSKEPDFYKHPIEDYFQKIDEAYERAKGYEYNSENPRSSYYSQRQELDEIMKLIAIYRSQRR